MRTTVAQPNLRAQQRVNVVADIVIEKPDGSICNCGTANLSRSGVMIACDQSTLSELIQDSTTLAPRNRTPVKAQFLLSAQSVQSMIIAQGNIVHFRRISRDLFHVGIQFTHFEGSGLDCVDQYVRSLLNAGREGA